jgi:hypothetical protein
LALEAATDNPAQKLYERLGWKQSSDFYYYFWECWKGYELPIAGFIVLTWRKSNALKDCLAVKRAFGSQKSPITN